MLYQQGLSYIYRISVRERKFFVYYNAKGDRLVLLTGRMRGRFLKYYNFRSSGAVVLITVDREFLTFIGYL